jgi:hypothetical protein
MPQRTVVAVALFFFASVAFAADYQIKDSPESHADILRDGKTLIRYMYARDASTEETKHDTYKVFHHVFDPTGAGPITKGPGGKFTHHRGLFIGFSKLTSHGKTTDLWHMKNTLQLHQGFVKQDAGAGGAVLASTIHWTIPDATIVKETRTLTVHDDETAHLVVDFVSELTALGSDAKFGGDPEHAGMQYRPHNDVADNKSAKYLFPRADSNVQKDLDLPWAALNYTLDDATYSVQHMNHPGNPSGTRYSAYRDYGRFGAFPTFEVKEGTTAILHYRIRVTKGDMPTREELEKQYQAFIAK